MRDLRTLTPADRHQVLTVLERVVDRELARAADGWDARWQRDDVPVEVRIFLRSWLTLQLVTVRADVLAFVHDLLTPRCVH